MIDKWLINKNKEKIINWTFFQLVFLFILVSFIFQKIELRKVLLLYKHMYKKSLFSSFMSTLTSYFGFLLAALTITSVLFIGLSKIRLIWNKLNEQFIKRKENFFTVFHLFFNCVNFQFLLIEIYGRYVLIFKDRYYLLFFPFFVF